MFKKILLIPTKKLFLLLQNLVTNQIIKKDIQRYKKIFTANHFF